MRRLVLASNNPGKLGEFRQMLAPLGMEVVPQSELGVPEAEEPHGTFVENALAKARHASRRSGLPAFADDSGICVAALNGAPGVQSARYASDAPPGGREAQDAANNRKLLAALNGKTDRRAHYYCVIVMVRHAEDPEPLIAEGRWHGEVIAAPRGAGGFGYDPHFLLPGLGRTAAELMPDEKNAVSHRGQAMRRLVEMLNYAEYRAS
ncbi:MAG TPA: RdgB/HAM1 family non-canonical purine NTP pyrophosphatase [Burkholderiales bacterium]|nr:RdgB/HAM1 family non-canonical purine NTP pyrophosphatase [Burkholderiales bacterium]